MDLIEILNSAWLFYTTHTNETVGIFTSGGAILTALVLFYTAKAANAAKNSTKVAQSTLAQATKNSQKDDFIKQFTLLLDQHNSYHIQLKDYLDTKKGKILLQQIIDGTNHLLAFNRLKGHSIISPYMRVLYHLLRHIDKDFYSKGENLKEKKKYSSLVRSLIRNDIMLLIAVNASYTYENGEVNDFGAYQLLLKKFSFFEHALFFNIRYDNAISSKDVIDNDFSIAKDRIRDSWISYLSKLNSSFILDEHSVVFPKIPFIVSCIFKNPMHAITKSMLNTVVIELRYIIAQNSDVRYKNNPLDYFFGRFIGASVTSYHWRFSSENEKKIKAQEIEKSKKLNRYDILKLINKVNNGEITRNSGLKFITLHKEGYPKLDADVGYLIDCVSDFNGYLKTISYLNDEWRLKYIKECHLYFFNVRKNIIQQIITPQNKMIDSSH
ncbi:hypothetical protein F3J31_10790 [Enterobacter sp. Acro-832]|uniref:putative phage abortive infection protein n=1 Tax=Enterobacter sp. Acro-832 TaxID=2608348 RepID=UPI0014205767|nr:putative phage abortive infection protein [Enterobacter sp. Acro-832]NIG44305.1 hypothetical protein [Enterobacter sp. Acro-832]